MTRQVEIAGIARGGVSPCTTNGWENIARLWPLKAFCAKGMLLNYYLIACAPIVIN